MKLLFRACFFLLPVMIITSCNKDNGDDIDDIIGTYIGAMNVDTPSFTNAQYTVVVTKLSASRVQITPSTSAAEQWSATLTNVLGVYTCISCVTTEQITFTKISGRYQLSYNRDNNNEQFGGLKQ